MPIVRIDNFSNKMAKVDPSALFKEEPIQKFNKSTNVRKITSVATNLVRGEILTKSQRQKLAIELNVHNAYNLQEGVGMFAAKLHNDKTKQALLTGTFSTSCDPTKAHGRGASVYKHWPLTRDDVEQLPSLHRRVMKGKLKAVHDTLQEFPHKFGKADKHER